MCYSESKRPVVIITKGKFDGHHAVLQYVCEDHHDNRHWRIRLLDSTRKTLDRFGYDENNRVKTTISDQIQICLFDKHFIKTQEYALPLINNNNQSSMDLLEKWHGRTRTSVERYCNDKRK